MWGDRRDRQIQHLIHFDGNGAGMRFRDEPLEPGAELPDGGSCNQVARGEQPPNPSGFGQVSQRKSGSSLATEVKRRDRTVRLNLGGEAVVLVVHVVGGGIRVRVVEDVERQAGLRLDLEVCVASRIADADRQFVGCRLPEERDLETVVCAMGKLDLHVVAPSW
jgi:hypothetical protein